MLVCICMFQNILCICGWLDKIPVPAWVIQMKSLNFPPKRNSLACGVFTWNDDLIVSHWHLHKDNNRCAENVSRLPHTISHTSPSPREAAISSPPCSYSSPFIPTSVILSCRHALGGRSVTTKICGFFCLYCWFLYFDTKCLGAVVWKQACHYGRKRREKLYRHRPAQDIH